MRMFLNHRVENRTLKQIVQSNVVGIVKYHQSRQSLLLLITANNKSNINFTGAATKPNIIKIIE